MQGPFKDCTTETPEYITKKRNSEIIETLLLPHDFSKCIFVLIKEALI